MPIRNANEYVGHIEYRERVRSALATARARLKRDDFSNFSPPIEQLIRDVGREIETYEQETLMQCMSVQYGSITRVPYCTYRVEGRSLPRVQPSIFLGSAATRNLLWGTFSTTWRPQLELGFMLPTDPPHSSVKHDHIRGEVSSQSLL